MNFVAYYQNAVKDTPTFYLLIYFQNIKNCIREFLKYFLYSRSVPSFLLFYYFGSWIKFLLKSSWIRLDNKSTSVLNYNTHNRLFSLTHLHLIPLNHREDYTTRLCTYMIQYKRLLFFILTLSTFSQSFISQFLKDL